MQEMTVPRAGARQGSPLWISWREAITPVSRASRRRWVAFFVVVLLWVSAALGWGEGVGMPDGVFPWLTLICLAIVSGLLRRATRGLTGGHEFALDERDEATRNSAYRIAYPLFGAVVAATVGGLVAVMPDLLKDGQATLDSFLVIGVIVWLLVWLSFLPLAVLAWTEPDRVPLEHDPAESAGVPESLRDAMVMAGLVGVALTDTLMPPPSAWPLVILIVTLSLVAGLKRWAVGQNPISNGLHTFGIYIGLLGFAGLVIAISGNGDPLYSGLLTAAGVTLAVLASLRA